MPYTKRCVDCEEDKDYKKEPDQQHLPPEIPLNDMRIDAPSVFAIPSKGSKSGLNIVGAVEQGTHSRVAQSPPPQLDARTFARDCPQHHRTGKYEVTHKLGSHPQTCFCCAGSCVTCKGMVAKPADARAEVAVVKADSDAAADLSAPLNAVAGLEVGIKRLTLNECKEARFRCGCANYKNCKKHLQVVEDLNFQGPLTKYMCCSFECMQHIESAHLQEISMSVQEPKLTNVKPEPDTSDEEFAAVVDAFGFNRDGMREGPDGDGQPGSTSAGYEGTFDSTEIVPPAVTFGPDAPPAPPTDTKLIHGNAPSDAGSFQVFDNMLLSDIPKASGTAPAESFFIGTESGKESSDIPSSWTDVPEGSGAPSQSLEVPSAAPAEQNSDETPVSRPGGTGRVFQLVELPDTGLVHA